MEISSKENLEKYRIMIVEDEPDIAEGLKYLIERMGYSYFVTGIFYNGQDGVNQVVQQKPDIIITDIRMPGMDGLEMIQKIQNVMQNCNFIVLSGYADFAYAREALRLGVQDYLTKPVDEEELYRVLKQGHNCSFMIGDIRKNGNVIPLGFNTMQVFLNNGFTLKEIIIKEQHNCSSTKYWQNKIQNLNFYLLAHEYIFVLSK